MNAIGGGGGAGAGGVISGLAALGSDDLPEATPYKSADILNVSGETGGEQLLWTPAMDGAEESGEMPDTSDISQEALQELGQ